MCLLLSLSQLAVLALGDDVGINNKVTVCVRCRPMTLQESRMKRAVAKDVDKLGGKLVIDDKSFVFDKVFNENCTQDDVYKSIISQRIEQCFQGFNATIFAYGQTGRFKFLLYLIDFYY